MCRRIFFIFPLLFFASFFCSPLYASAFKVEERISWDASLNLPGLDGKPNPGVAGAYSGFVGDDLLIAGGANFPDKKPWEEGGKKAWWSTLYYRNVQDDMSWQILEDALPEPRAYGVSVALPEGLLCIGGCGPDSCYSDVFLLALKEGNVSVSSDWPSLPVPLAHASGALLDNKIFVAGGQENMDSPCATSHFFMLDLSQKESGWQVLDSWPGKPRGFAVSAVQSNGVDKCFYLFSGRDYDAEGNVEILSDGYVYNPKTEEWSVLSGEFPVMAGTAVPQGANHLLLLGGSDSMLPAGERHPGFDNRVRLFHTVTQTLVVKEESPYAIPLTTNVLAHDGAFYLTSGEIHPGVRTPEIVSFRILPYEKNFGIVNYLVIAFYFMLLAWIGYYFSKRQKNTDDYFKGGGRIPWWVVGLSIFGTALSAITFMAIPAKAYASDWSYIFINAGILLVVPIIIYLFIPFFRKLDSTTAYEYLEARFNYAVRMFSSLSFILFQIGRMGVVLYLPSIALNVVTGLDIILCITLMGVLSLAYTMMGGIEAVVWTEALQVVVLMGGAVLCIVYMVCNTDGGFAGIVSVACDDRKFALGSLAFDLRQPALWTVLIASFFTNITTYGTDQTMVQRYMTTETEEKARKSVLTNACLTIPASLIFFFVGTALYVFYKQHPFDLSLTISDGDAIFPWYIFSQLPQGVTGLLVSGIFAAAMSTLSSSMNSAATAYVVDIHSRFHKGSSLKTAKSATAFLGCLGIGFAYIMATWEISSLWDEFNKILGLILGSMGGLFLLGILTRRANASGAVCGIVGSIGVQIYFINTQSVHLLLYTATGIISCFVIGYLCSLFFKTRKNDILHLTVYKH